MQIYSKWPPYEDNETTTPTILNNSLHSPKFISVVPIMLIVIRLELVQAIISYVPLVTDYEVALEFFYGLKWGSNIAHRLPAPLGCFIVPHALIIVHASLSA